MSTVDDSDDHQIEPEGADPEASTSSSLLRGISTNPSHTPEMNNSSLSLASIQPAANLLAHSLALLSLLVVSRWVFLLGGLSWKEGESKQVFNWHPLLMIVAFNFMTVATLSFRFPFRSLVRSLTKLTHGIAWAVAALSAGISLVAVFKSHNDGVSGYIANLYSLHSWIGSLIIGGYILQFVMGAYAFWFSNQPSLKAAVWQFHIVVGPILYFSVAGNILLGIQEKEGFVGCSYSVQDGPDIFPLPNLGMIPDACLVSHTLGILVASTAVATYVALFNSRGASVPHSQRSE